MSITTSGQPGLTAQFSSCMPLLLSGDPANQNGQRILKLNNVNALDLACGKRSQGSELELLMNLIAELTSLLFTYFNHNANSASPCNIPAGYLHYTVNPVINFSPNGLLLPAQPGINSANPLSAPSHKISFENRATEQPEKPVINNGIVKVFNGFRQSYGSLNCVTVSAIKAAMIKFGQSPAEIYQQVTTDNDGFNITMRDGFTLRLSPGELQQATRASGFTGDDIKMLSDANFMYAVSAKRAQLENNDGHASRSYANALRSLDDTEHSGEGLKRLGLTAYMSRSSAQVLANGTPGTLERNGHSVAVINGREEIYGTIGNVPRHGYAIALG